MSKTKPYGANRCPNCGEYGSHYCGPSFGDEGFFICKPKSEGLEVKALKLFKALVESKEHKKIMEDHYGNDK